MKTILSLMVVGLIIILVVSFVSKGTPTADLIAKPVKVCNPGEVKDVIPGGTSLGVNFFEYKLCSDSGAWTGPHTATSLPGGN